MKFAREIVWEIACSIDEAENCTKVTGFEGKLRPEWAEKQDLAVKSEGLAGFAPGLPLSRGNYGQISEKSKIWP